MNVNEKDFQDRLDEIGALYENCKDAIYSIDSRWPFLYTDKALECLVRLRDIAAIAVKQAYQLKEN